METSHSPDWVEWWRDDRWKSKPRAREALRLLQSLEGTERDRHITAVRAVTCCFRAVAYTPAKDPGRVYRQRMKEQRNTAKSLARAANTLAKACERGDAAILWAIRWPLGKQPIRSATLAGAWLQGLAENLEGKLPELHGGPFLHRYTIGNMHRDKPIREGARTTVAAMLAFELTFYLRMHMAGRAGDAWQAAAKMPTDGKPCANIVAAFVNAVLGGTRDRREVADLISKIPRDVGLMPWPDETE